MNDEKKIELNAWINEHVFGKTQYYAVMKDGYYYRPMAHGYTTNIKDAWHCALATAQNEIVLGENMKVVPVPIDDYASELATAFAVLKKCIEKLGWENPLIIGQTADGDYSVTCETFKGCTKEKSLETCICQFARQLFTKGKTHV